MSQNITNTANINASNSMFCFQCEQTAGCTGCTRAGVCGKSAMTAKLQDTLTGALIALANTAACSNKNSNNTDTQLRNKSNLAYIPCHKYHPQSQASYYKNACIIQNLLPFRKNFKIDLNQKTSIEKDKIFAQRIHLENIR